ncbi:hypothetical protein TGRUB_285260 [Toxoplasma gondii RUB]|uniref:Uncharacterized protein n=2 Tax=Toxoplasma gondii TaxID=5811 RepID=A0A086M396_TOXGO|nr:hypothetical protein TGRUB_285260 [Toxoplasma gondii RUB]KFH08264.1 hypothetical protein TGVAND_285260 [Toxoplasma gondii VAND]
MENHRNARSGEEARRQTMGKEGRIREAYPSLFVLFQHMRDSLYLPKYQEVIAAIQADLDEAEKRGAAPSGSSVAVDRETEKSERPRRLVEFNGDEEGVGEGKARAKAEACGCPEGEREGDDTREQRTRIFENKETAKDTEVAAGTPDEAWWWLCSNPPSFPFYEVYTQELIDLLAAYLHRRICERFRAAELRGNGCESEGVHFPLAQRKKQESQAKTSPPETHERRRQAALSPLRVLEIGAGTGLLARHLTTALDSLLLRHPPHESPCCPCCSASVPSSSVSSGFSPSSSSFSCAVEREMRTAATGGCKHLNLTSDHEPGCGEGRDAEKEYFPGKGKWYSYLASEARRDLRCLYRRVVFGDFRELLASYMPHICICSWMPFNIDWTGIFRNFSRVQEVMWVEEERSMCLRPPGEATERRTERQESCRRPNSGTQTNSEPAAVASEQAFSSLPSCRENDEEAVDTCSGREEKKQTGVEDYVLIGHAEFGLVGKPMETWGLRLPAHVHLPQGVEFRRQDITCSGESSDTEGKSELPLQERKRQRDRDSGIQRDRDFEGGGRLQRVAVSSGVETGGISPAGRRRLWMNVGDEKTHGTPFCDRCSDIGQDCPLAVRATETEEEIGKGVESTGADESALHSEMYQANGHGEAGGDCVEEGEETATLLPLQERLYWRDGYTRVHLGGSDEIFQCSRFDAVESLANGGASSSRVSIFRKRRV